MLLYIVVINIIGLLLMKWDKYLARKQKWRIPENRIWLIALVGGAFGTTMGMYMFRHKTKHMKFILFLPILAILQVIGLIYWQFGDILS